MKKHNCLILDVAHGADVHGKCSPDSEFKEYKWSRNKISDIIKMANKFTLNFDIVSPFLNTEIEPGLTNRVLKYNAISKSYTNTVMVSMHTDAITNPPAWQDDADHFKFFTSRGNTPADAYATKIGEAFKKYMPEESYSFAYWQDEKIRDLDWEADFTILAGNKRGVKPLYHGILIENTFMDNKKCVENLTNPGWDELHTVTSVLAFMEMFNHKIIQEVEKIKKRDEN